MKASGIGFIFPLFLYIVAYTLTCENSVEAVSYNANAWKICARVGLEVFCFAAQKRNNYFFKTFSCCWDATRKGCWYVNTSRLRIFQETIEWNNGNCATMYIVKLQAIEFTLVQIRIPLVNKSCCLQAYLLFVLEYRFAPFKYT